MIGKNNCGPSLRKSQNLTTDNTDDSDLHGSKKFNRTIFEFVDSCHQCSSVRFASGQSIRRAGRSGKKAPLDFYFSRGADVEAAKNRNFKVDASHSSLTSAAKADFFISLYRMPKGPAPPSPRDSNSGNPLTHQCTVNVAVLWKSLPAVFQAFTTILCVPTASTAEPLIVPVLEDATSLLSI